MPESERDETFPVGPYSGRWESSHKKKKKKKTAKNTLKLETRKEKKIEKLSGPVHDQFRLEVWDQNNERNRKM
jgi:hypothetical protein